MEPVHLLSGLHGEHHLTVTSKTIVNALKQQHPFFVWDYRCLGASTCLTSIRSTDMSVSPIYTLSVHLFLVTQSQISLSLSENEILLSQMVVADQPLAPSIHNSPNSDNSKSSSNKEVQGK